jgi:hypothetical protein
MNIIICSTKNTERNTQSDRERERDTDRNTNRGTYIQKDTNIKHMHRYRPAHTENEKQKH